MRRTWCVSAVGAFSAASVFASGTDAPACTLPHPVDVAPMRSPQAVHEWLEEDRLNVAAIQVRYANQSRIPWHDTAS